MGQYADTFLFHLPEDICKGLSMGQYKYGFEFDSVIDGHQNRLVKMKRIKLNHIMLVSNLTPASGSRRRIK